MPERGRNVNSTSAGDVARPRPTERSRIAMVAALHRAGREVAGRLRFCLRMTAAGMLAFAISHLFEIPLQGLWAVLTAVVVTQVSVGESLRATIEYVVGTLCGAAYAGAVGVLVPHTSTLALEGALALIIAPLAIAAAFSARFRVAPFTAVLVLLISQQLGEDAIHSALYRSLEVGLGGATAVVVSFLVFPDRAHGLSLDGAARVLEQLAQALPQLLTGFSRRLDPVDIRSTQDAIGRAVDDFQATVADSQRERWTFLGPHQDPGPLSRTLLRLRHDLIIIGRAAVAPLPSMLLAFLGAPLARVTDSASNYLRESAIALTLRCSPPPLCEVEPAIESYGSAMEILRSEDLTRTLSSAELERIFALGFALEQLRQNFSDLDRCIKEFSTARQTRV